MNPFVGTSRGTSSEMHKFNSEEIMTISQTEDVSSSITGAADAVSKSEAASRNVTERNQPGGKGFASRAAVHSRESDDDWDWLHPATIAALDFQVACLVDDGYSTIDWPNREPDVVNKPGDFARKYEALRRIARAYFPRRGDVEDVLDHTIDEYRLWSWGSPFGFWTAFKRNMIDAKKAACNSKSIYLEHPQRSSSDGIRTRRNSHEWTETPQVNAIDRQTAQNWLRKQSAELHASEPPVSEKWGIVEASDDKLDRLFCEAGRRIMADDEYMEELASSKRQAPTSTRLIAEIRSLAKCSQAEAYRLLHAFRERHSSALSKKVEANADSLRKNATSLAMYSEGQKENSNGEQ
jgi:hypothetical protein